MNEITFISSEKIYPLDFIIGTEMILRENNDLSKGFHKYGVFCPAPRQLFYIKISCNAEARKHLLPYCSDIVKT